SAQEPAPRKPGGRGPAKGSPRRGGHPGLPATEVRRITDLYATGISIAAVARATGYHVGTVAKYLNRSSAEKHTGRPRQEWCGAGLHRMSEHGREVKTGGRYCAECKRIRARETYLAQKARRDAARATPTQPLEGSKAA
ncbi:MAG TPA: hypothetical protein VGF17_20165, partial [Phytomonospora sp.]